jgi:hypothetical protein
VAPGSEPPARPRPLARWIAYTAAGVGFAFAVPNLYWGLGGTRGLATLGGEIERRAREGDEVILALNWVSVVLKVLGGLLALALVERWGRRLPRRGIRAAAWIGAGVLVVYGAAQTTAVLMAFLGIVEPEDHPGDSVLRWRLFVWEPWFLVWGLLLAVATWLSSPRQRTTGSTICDDRDGGHLPHGRLW